MDRTWLTDDTRFLSGRCPLPLDRPFRSADLAGHGVSRRDFAQIRERGLVRPVLRGVYVAAQAPDDMMSRALALSLVVPEEAVVSDRTAAWLHGVDVLPRTALVTPPPLSVVHTDDTRVRRPETDGRRRLLEPWDITTVHGVRVTTGLRTALDLGRLLRRDGALAAIDGFLRSGTPHDLMCAEAARFAGYRGVCQLRVLLPLGDGRAQSPGESALRLLWYDAGLPRPECQWEIYDGGVVRYYLDMVDEKLRYAAEYDGEAFHQDAEADEDRRAWIAEHADFVVDPFVYDNVFTPWGDAMQRMRRRYDETRRRHRRWSPGQLPAR